MTEPGASPPFTLSREAHSIRRSMMRDLIAITARPGIISFAGGLPAPELFPVDAWQAATDRVLTREGRAAMQYGPPYLPLQESIAALMAQRGASVEADQVFIVTGAQQGLHVAARLLMDPDSPVVLDRFVFTGVRQAFGGESRLVREVDNGPTGTLDGDGLGAAFDARPSPRVIVVVPDFHNPVGTSLSQNDRRLVLQVAGQHDAAVVEDDPYSWISFDGRLSRALVADAPERVLYIGSFSKIVAPALRLGWMIAPRPVIAKLRVIKESVDLETSGLTQRVAGEFLASGALEPHLGKLRRAYAERCAAMCAALERWMPAGTRWSRPDGGMFIWVELPDGHDTLAALEPAVEAGVAYVPGQAFASRPAARTMRLNFSNATVDQIGVGVALLGEVLTHHTRLAA
jgi:2-aminoadipate transaminase